MFEVEQKVQKESGRAEELLNSIGRVGLKREEIDFDSTHLSMRPSQRVLLLEG